MVDLTTTVIDEAAETALLIDAFADAMDAMYSVVLDPASHTDASTFLRRMELYKAIEAVIPAIRGREQVQC